MIKSRIEQITAKYSKAYNKLSSRNQKLVNVVILSTPIIIWHFWYIFTFNKIAPIPGDFDYFLQVQEAIRKSFLEYGQFPWWNPWIGGGVPLYANPQAGVFSIQTVLSFLFGSIYGLKLSILIYALVGFSGSWLLLRKFLRISPMYSALLGYTWVFSGFFVAHLPFHVTFAYYYFLPLLIYLQLRIKKRMGWLFFGAVLGLSGLAALHYAFFQTLLILILLAIGQLINAALNGRSDLKILIISYLKASATFMLIITHRLIYSAQYVGDSSRVVFDPPNSTTTVFKGLFLPGSGANFFGSRFLSGFEWGATEYSAYIGFAMLPIALVGLYCLSKIIRNKKLKLNNTQGKFLLFTMAGLLITVLLAHGESGRYSLYGFLNDFPVFESLKIPSRWLVFSSFFLTLVAGSLLKVVKKGSLAEKTVKVLIVIAFSEVLLFGLGQERAWFNRAAVSIKNEQFFQVEGFDPDAIDPSIRPGDEPIDKRITSYSFEATKNNIGELKGYEPLYETRFDTQGRCGQDSGCGLIATNNATIEEWSPNEIVIKRTSDGPIELNVAPSSYWTANSTRIYLNERVVEPGRLTVQDDSEIITLRIEPKSIFELVRAKVGQIF